MLYIKKYSGFIISIVIGPVSYTHLAGYATGSIIAGKIENRVPDVRIVSILSSDRIEHIDEYDCDLILSTIDTQADIHKDMRFLYVSPLISAQDLSLIHI